MSVEGPECFTGGCLCGSVRIVASGRPYRVGVCHCLDCRKHRPSRHPAVLSWRTWLLWAQAFTLTR